MAAPEKYTEIERKLGEPLKPLIAARRSHRVAWRRIALEISGRTGIDITGETLRIWHQGREPVVADANGTPERAA